MNLFWERGYDGTGMSDLEAHTGLNRSSLYNSFGPKSALFAAALEHYTERMTGGMLAALESGSQGLDDLEQFLRRLGAHFKASAGRGCFMVNTMAASPSEVAGWHGLASVYVDRFLDAMRAALRRAAALGEIPQTEVEPGARMVMGVVLGSILMSRARQPQPLIDAMLESALSHVRGRACGRGITKPKASARTKPAR